MKKETSDSKSFDAKKADSVVSYCNKCKDCWEIQTIRNNRRKGTPKEILYYKDFVTYGKPKKICPACNGEKGWMTTY